MTEQEWLTSTDPQAMLQSLARKNEGSGGSSGGFDQSSRLNRRKLRLFACATARLLENSSPHPEMTAVIEACEQIADGQPSYWGLADKGLRGARKSIDSVYGWVWACTCENIEYGLRDTIHQARGNSGSFYRQEEVAALLREVFGNPFKPVILVMTKAEDWASKHGHFSPEWITPQVLDLTQAAYDAQECECEACEGTGLELFWSKGPKCPICEGTKRVKKGLLDKSRFAILADALEDAGCNNETVLLHLRGQDPCSRCSGEGRVQTPPSMAATEAGYMQVSTGGVSVRCHYCLGKGVLSSQHVRGCWALDLLLRKE